MRKVDQVMGLPITVDIPNCESTSVFHTVFTRFHKIDERFSTYKKDSEVSLFSRGELKENELSGELKFVIKECRKAQKWTDGYFSAWAAGAFDPSGYVKGYAVGEAGKIIEKYGYKN
jgi:thiamine biosynthesis lipoprotein